MVTLFAAKTALISEIVWNRISDILPEKRLKRAYQIKFEAGQKQRLLSDLLLLFSMQHFYQKSIAFPTIELGVHGKPFLPHHPDFHYNISHSGEYVIIAIHHHELGVDIETNSRRAPFDVVKRFFSLKEQEDIFTTTNIEKRKQLFFQYWTIKEAYLKALGNGLTKPLNSFTVHLHNNDITRASILDDAGNIENWKIHLTSLDATHPLAVCHQANNITVSYITSQLTLLVK